MTEATAPTVPRVPLVVLVVVFTVLPRIGDGFGTERYRIRRGSRTVVAVAVAVVPVFGGKFG